MSQSSSARAAVPPASYPSRCPDRPAHSLGEWHGRGLCVGEDPDVFFPSHGDPGAEARQICGNCAVRGECLDYATAADECGHLGRPGRAGAAQPS